MLNISNKESIKNSVDKERDIKTHIEEIMRIKEIAKLNFSRKDIEAKIKNYRDETGKYAIWRDNITKEFLRYLKGEKIYDRDKERISLYVSEETKDQWQDFIKAKNYSTISKLIRESVNYFIEQKSKLFSDNLYEMDLQKISNISHALKEPLTTIKGFSQLLIENYKDELSEEILSNIKNIFDQSILLENKIKNILDDISVEHPQIDILLIEDDLATIRLITTYFESKGYTCKGVISASKGIEELRNSTPKVILLDIILPDVSGYDLCKEIKANEDFKDIPIYYLSAIPNSEIKKRMEETRADGYILKPFDFSDFEILFEYL